jgi:hypothetical protein
MAFINIFLSGFPFFVEFIDDLQVIYKSDRFFIIVNPFLFSVEIFYKNFGFFGIIPEIGRKGLLLQVGDLYFFGINVKDTSLTQPGDL